MWLLSSVCFTCTAVWLDQEWKSAAALPDSVHQLLRLCSGNKDLLLPWSVCSPMDSIIWIFASELSVILLLRAVFFCSAEFRMRGSLPFWLSTRTAVALMDALLDDLCRGAFLKHFPVILVSCTNLRTWPPPKMCSYSEKVYLLFAAFVTMNEFRFALVPSPLKEGY